MGKCCISASCLGQNCAAAEVLMGLPALEGHLEMETAFIRCPHTLLSFKKIFSQKEYILPGMGCCEDRPPLPPRSSPRTRADGSDQRRPFAAKMKRMPTLHIFFKKNHAKFGTIPERLRHDLHPLPEGAVRPLEQEEEEDGGEEDGGGGHRENLKLQTLFNPS